MKDFYYEIYKLKTLKRKGWQDTCVCDLNTHRCESIAEHGFSLAILALDIIKKESLTLDIEKVLKMCLYHDFCEVDYGDISVCDNMPCEKKYKIEITTIERLEKEYNMPELTEIWKEFEKGETKEAKFVNAMDKLDAIKQSKIYSEINNRPEVFEEFYSTSYEYVKDFIKYI